MLSVLNVRRIDFIGRNILIAVVSSVLKCIDHNLPFLTALNIDQMRRKSSS